MEAIEKRKESALQPAQVRLEEAAIAVLIERIASLDKEIKDDLVAVIMDVQNCSSQEDLQEVEQTVRELLFPQAYGNMIVGSGGNPQGSETLLGWSKQIGERIRQLREKIDWTQKQLAEKSGLRQSHISRLETGQHSPSHKTIVALAKALGCTIAEIDPGAATT